MNKKLLLCLFMWVMCMPAFAQETLTVFDGTTEGTGTATTVKTNDYLPAYTRYWNKAGTKSQFIIPASYLADMKGGEISSVKFYSTSYNTPYTSASTADVYVGEVNYTAFDSDHFEFEPKANCTIIYQGTVTVERVGPTNQEWGEMTITFTTPYKYRGGNLLIGFENTTTEGWKQFKFRGQEVMWHAGLAGCWWTDTYYYKQQCDFIPWTTFTYTPGTLPAYEEFYLVGTFNEWSQAEDGGRLVFEATEEEGVFETEGTLEAGAEFKVITPDGDNWIWFGGQDENGVGYFLINNDLLNVPLQMVDGSNFRIENGGKFTFRVNVNDMTLTVIPVAAPVVTGDVDGDGDVTSADITALYSFLLSGDMSNIVNGDQDNDGDITSADVTFVYSILLGV
ncbi:MAG: dockerin type I repeat-containing protein [Muribaculaceae bacterium]|nr:dockerin type I repeat-containing protein [Muribaculaceae bacterium]